MAIGDTSCTGIAGAELRLKKRLLAYLGIHLVLGVQLGDLVGDLVEDLVGELLGEDISKKRRVTCSF